MQHSSRVALVTGANKGIGLSIVKQLAHQEPSLIVLLGSRDPQRGEEAEKKLSLSNVKSLVIDLDNEDTIKAAASTVREQYGGLDILINNAGMAFKGDAWGEHVARTTINTNYFGTLNVCKHFMPLIKDNGRVVNVSSRAGLLKKLTSSSLRRRFENPDVTIEEVSEAMNMFIKAVADDTWKQDGWPGTTYGVSKIGVSALTRILAREEAKNKERQGVLITATCPGWCATDMAGPSASRTADQGAEVEVWLAMLPPGQERGKEGKFFAENRELSYTTGDYV